MDAVTPITHETVPDPAPGTGNSLGRRLAKLLLILGLALLLIYGFLPWMTGQFSMTRRMAASLEQTGIDPSRYYYTDVEQVIESEQYLRTVLTDQ